MVYLVVINKREAFLSLILIFTEILKLQFLKFYFKIVLGLHKSTTRFCEKGA
jgi:hypothetical protein